MSFAHSFLEPDTIRCLVPFLKNVRASHALLCCIFLFCLSFKASLLLSVPSFASGEGRTPSNPNCTCWRKGPAPNPGKGKRPLASPFVGSKPQKTKVFIDETQNNTTGAKTCREREKGF